MNLLPRPIYLLVLLPATCCLSGCLGGKPAPAMSRYFVLAPVAPEAGQTQRTNSAPMVVGVGPVKLPGYLGKNSLAVRKSSNEIEYLENAEWAERLDQGFQNAFATDLSLRLPNHKVRATVGRGSDLACEIQVIVQQFDIDTRGHGVLSAWWQIISSPKSKVLNSGQFRASRDGPRPDADPHGATATLSQLLADLSAEVANAIHDVPK